MSSRDEILASVRANLPKTKSPLPAPSLFDQSPPTSLIETFRTSLARMGGRVVGPGPADDPLAPVRALIEQSRLVCSATPEIASGRDLSAVAEPRDLADVDHAVARAVLGVAETGSVLLTDESLKVNALAYLAQHLVVLLDPSDIVANLHHAYARPEPGDHAYTVFHTGPSATADIEGVLILGAQGVRSLSVVLAPRPVEASGITN